MIEILNKNTKIKIISLLSAIVLWMYVMAVVDPEDTKLFEEIPITITNIHEINDLGLVVDPDEELVASVYVKGNLSDLQKITANNINVYGTVNNPIEGQNQLYLRASASDKVSTDFKSDTIVINLEKSIEKEQKINVEITGQYKDDVDTITLSEKNVMVSGPRSRVESIKYVQAVFNADKKLSKTQSTQLELKALDADRKEVNHVTLVYTPSIGIRYALCVATATVMSESAITVIPSIPDAHYCQSTPLYFTLPLVWRVQHTFSFYLNSSSRFHQTSDTPVLQTPFFKLFQDYFTNYHVLQEIADVCIHDVKTN